MTSPSPRSLATLGAAAAAGSLLLLAACSSPTDGVACTGSVEPAIVVEIRDARTGAAIAAGAQGVVTDGAYSDPLLPYESSGPAPDDLYSRRAAAERPGTYAVQVTHAGYQPWSAAGVQVGRDVCHVRTRRLKATLQPSAG